MSIRFPVYLREPMEQPVPTVDAFASLEEMEGYLEAIDVENEEYEAWDADGNRLKLQVAEEGPHWLQVMPTGTADITGLCDAVHAHARTAGIPASDLKGLSPAAAVERIEQHEHSRKPRLRWLQFWRRRR